MITGDNPLTACHVAKELLFTPKKPTLLLKKRGGEASEDWIWESIDESIQLPLDLSNTNSSHLTAKHHLCLTGDVSY